jgi:hypothetical protein
MDNCVLVCDGPRVALTTRDRIHLDDLFWHNFVRDRRSFFWDTDIMLNNLASGLRWFDVTQVKTEYRHDDLFIRRVADAFIFDLMKNESVSTIAMCEWKDGQLCYVPIYNSSKCCDVIPWDHLIGYWSDSYKQAVYDVYGLDVKGWPYQMFMLARELFDFGKYDDAHELFRCAIARAKIENDDELVAKLENLEQQLLER